MQADKTIRRLVALALLPLLLFFAAVPAAAANQLRQRWMLPQNAQFISPMAVAADSLGNIYVVDTENRRIQKFDSSGNYLNQWGSLGSGNGQFGHPTGVAVDGQGHVYVVDEGNNRVQKFDSNGGYLGQWGGYGSGNGQFSDPRSVAVDGQGHVYVADTSNHRIQKFDSTGKYLASYVLSDGDLLFPNPLGLAVDSRGHIYVSFYSQVICYYPPENAITPILHLLLD